jgi:hypothetical protein
MQDGKALKFLFDDLDVPTRLGMDRWKRFWDMFCEVYKMTPDAYAAGAARRTVRALLNQQLSGNQVMMQGLGRTPAAPDPVEAPVPPDLERVGVPRLVMVQNLDGRTCHGLFCVVCATYTEMDCIPKCGSSGGIKECPNCGVPVTKKMKVAKYIRNRKP